MPPSNSNDDDAEAASLSDDFGMDEFLRQEGRNNASRAANSSSNGEIGELESSGMSEFNEEDADDEPDFRPFNRNSKYPHEGKVYFGVLGVLLLGAHLQYVSVWWVFAWSVAIVIPGEVKKVHTYGLDTYLGKLHFKRPTLRDFGLVVGGLVSIVVLLTGLVIGVFAVDSLISSAGESMLMQSGGGPQEGGHLISNAVMNWWIYGIGVVIMFLIVGPAEELMFRHELQNFMKKEGSRTRALIWTNVIFALLHLPVIVFVPNLLLMMIPLLGIFTLGMVFSLQYEQTDNLFVPSVTHSIWNSFVLTLLLLGV